MVVIQMGLTESKLASRVDTSLGMRLRDVCSYEPPGAQFSPLARKRDAWGEKVWDGKVSLYNRQRRTFPTGVLARVIGVLDGAGIPYELRGDPDLRLPEIDLPIAPGWELRDYQTEVVEDALSRKRCMIQVATGGGKTVIAGAIMHRVRRVTLFLVHTRDLLLQAKESFSSMFGEERVGQVGDGVVDIRDITVATIQTIASIGRVKYERADEDDIWRDPTQLHAPDMEEVRAWLQTVGLVFADECHRVAAPTAAAVVREALNAPYRYGLSASPWRDDGADIVLEGAFGAVGSKISASQLIDEGFLVPPIIRMLPVPPRPYTRKDPFETIYVDYVVQNEARNALGERSACSMVRRGRATLVLVRRLEHGRAVAASLSRELGFEVPFLSGEDDGLVRKAVIDDIRAERLGCVVASTIADEGLDVKPLSGLVLLGGGKSSTRALQRVGRVLRPWKDKRNAEVVDFQDNALHLISHSAAREKLYGTEPGFVVLDV